MILFLFLVISLVLAFISVYISENHEDLAIPFMAAYAITTLITFVICIYSMLSNMLSPIIVEEYRNEYTTLVYKLENDVFENDSEKRKLYEDIAKWNENLAIKQSMQNDIWFGILYPNIYESFNYIYLTNE